MTQSVNSILGETSKRIGWDAFNEELSSFDVCEKTAAEILDIAKYL